MELICKPFYFFVHLYGNKLHQERMHSIILYLIFVIVFSLILRVTDEETMVQHWVSFLIFNLYLKKVRLIIIRDTFHF